MNYIFRIRNKTGREIYLTKERWTHITENHPEMSSPEKIEEIENTIRNPDLITPHKYDEKKRNYYKYYKDKKRYLLVIVKYLNGEGHVSTSFITRKIIRR